MQQFMWRTRRYELGLMRDGQNVARATNDHERILAALENCELDEACTALRVNMQTGRQPILDWLAQRATARIT